ncbi:hypothetical protein lerEdw1_020778 [Lerista edwardsae]|nr:hypothetical protein lerEdw1_020778 [Lerista edwardsae]
MAAAAGTAEQDGDLHRELTCSLCLELFREPVLLECGHCFCQACIGAFWSSSQQRTPSCPECRALCLNRRCTPSRLLRNLADRARRQQERADPSAGHGGPGGCRTGRREGGSSNSSHARPPAGQCGEHGDAVRLFCTTDESLVCYRCAESPAHAGHSFCCLRKVAQSYKEKLSRVLGPLETRIQDLERVEKCQEEKMRSLKNSSTSLRAAIEEEFSEMQKFLCQRKNATLAQLEKDEDSACQGMLSHMWRIREGLSAVREMMKQGKNRLEQTDQTAFLLVRQTPWHLFSRVCNQKLEVIGDIKQFLEQLSAASVSSAEDPNYPSVDCRELCLGKFRGPTQYLTWKAMKSLLRLELEPIHLDSSTAHPVLRVISNVCVMVGESPCRSPNDSRRFQNFPIVLGKEGFHCGKHYWEVEVKDKRDWRIGVALESIPRKEEGQNTSSLKDKVWCLEPTEETNKSEKTTLWWRVGVYLDYEKGQVSFYEAKNGSHLHTHRTRFSEKVYPFFQHTSVVSGQKSMRSLTICHK